MNDFRLVLITLLYFLKFSFQSVKDSAYDHHSAIYHLLLDKLKKHPKTIMNKLPNIEGVPNLPMATRTERRSSITTGVGKLS